MTTQRLVLAGGSGFLGVLLADWFATRAWDVVVLTRRDAPLASPGRAVVWDGQTVGAWRAELDGACAVINLAGRSVNCRYHAKNRNAILRSRVDSTRALGAAIATCTRPPAVWLNSSTATIYKHSFDREMDECSGTIEGTAEAKDQFSIDVATAWERAFAEAATPGTRKVALRTAMVLSTHEGTVYRVLRRLVRLRLGGAIAGGRQFVSWLHERDFCRAIDWLIGHGDFSGAVNLAAPRPVTNRELMATIRGACHTGVGLPAARWMLEVGTWLLRTESELVIKSRRVIPARLSAAGFEFLFPDVASAIGDLERQMSDNPAASAAPVLTALSRSS